ncbi:MAG: transglycosylase SLT domain-containing protein [Desulfosarcina sp.]|nr:transglycosylase SLT domain-containing protein [Desulfosarcina sp.]
MHHKPVRLWILVFSVLLGLFHRPVLAAEEPFPLYPVIEPNVTFWTTIYARYSTTQAVVHDSVDLDIVYEVIDLEPADHLGARKINRRRMRQAGQRVESILKRLATHPLEGDAGCRRVAALFGPGADARTFSQARHRVRCQIGQRDRFQAGLIRSGAYIDRMRAILTSNGVPGDLAYLPHVESSFNTDAYSKFGAAGMWQFTRSTGKRFMTVDYVLDERRDPIVAARAAARLLKENHDRLGSWPLAITAYNHGAAGMQRAKAAHGDYPDIFTSYKGRAFKFASRNFYAEFLAARRVASDYQRYFGPLALNAPIRSRAVSLDGFAAFADLCRHFEVSPHVLRAMNPALRPPVFSGQKYVPKGYVLNLPALPESEGLSLAGSPSKLFKTAQKPSRFYTVQRGDTAGKIARMHRVKLDDLILANNMDRRATVYVRQTLRIPQAGESVRSEKKPQPLIPRDPVVLVAAGDIADTTPAIPERIPVQQQPVGIVQVEVEETLGHYAEWAGVRASRIRRLNNLPFGQPLLLHQTIKIPLEDVSAEDFEAQRYDFHKRLHEDFFAAYRVGDLQRYRVQPGDSYWTLCRDKFDLPLWLLRHYNAGVNLAALKIHQPLMIPAIESLLENSPEAAAREATPEA